MASYGYTFTSGDSVTPTKLNSARTVSDIVNADIKSDAAIAGTKIAPNFGSQNIVTTGSASTGSATLTAGGAALTLVNSSAAANQKNWDLVTTAVGLQVRARNDAGSGGGNTFDFTRSSEQVNEFSGSNSGNKWFVVDNANQRVGIGTSSPSEKLNVVGNAKADGKLVSARAAAAGSTAAGCLELQIDGVSHASVSTANSNTMLLHTGGSERMRIDASGNVLIGMTGTATSSAKTLHMANATAPTANPSGGGVLYVESGALKYRGSSGTVTTIANA